MGILAENDDTKGLEFDRLNAQVRLWIEQTDLPSQVTEAIKAKEVMVTADTSVDAIRGVHLMQLAALLAHHFQRYGRREDINTGISQASTALEMCQSSDISQVLARLTLATSLRFRFERFGRESDIQASINHAETALRITTLSVLDRSLLLNGLGSSLTRRFERFGHDEDIRLAISHHREALQYETLPLSSRSQIQSDLGISLRFQFERFAKDEDIDSSVYFLDAGVKQTLPDHPSLILQQSELGYSLLTRFGRYGKESDIKSSIEHLRKALSACPSGHAARPLILDYLGSSLINFFARYSRDKDLSEAIKMLNKAADLTAMDHPARAPRLVNLGAALQYRFGRFGRKEDIDASVSRQSDALSLCRDDDPARAIILGVLGQSLDVRFKQYHGDEDLDNGIKCMEKAVSLLPEDHPSTITVLNNLGSSLMSRFQRYGKAGDLDAAATNLDRALHLRKADDPSLPNALNNLAVVYRARFRLYNGDDDVATAISLLEKALDKAPKDDPSYRRLLFNNLGSLHMLRFERKDPLRTHIDAAITHHREALKSTELDQPSRALTLNNLGLSLRLRFDRFGEDGDIEASVKYLEDAVELSPEDSSARSTWLNNLGSSLMTRFARFGRSEDIDAAIMRQREAIKFVSDDEPAYAGYTSDLGLSLQARFERFDDEDDIVSAIDRQQDSLEHTEDGDPLMAKRLSRFGAAFTVSYERYFRDEDIDNAVNLHRASVEACGNDDPLRVEYINNLGTSLIRRFQRHGRLEDANEAVNRLEEVVCLCPVDDASYPVYLGNLAQAFLSRFDKFERAEDLDAAINHSEKSCSGENPLLCTLLTHLGLSLLRRFEVRTESSDFTRGIDCLRRAVLVPDSAPRDRFMAALRWATHAHKYASVQPPSIRSLPMYSALDGYQHAIRLLTEVTWLGLTATSRLDQLVPERATLAADAAACALELAELSDNPIQTEEYLIKAVELLDQGRSILWSQMSQLRNDDPHLHNINPELDEQLRRVAQALDAAGLKSSPSGVLSEQQGQLRRQLARDWDALVIRARALHPELRNFMLPVAWKDLREGISDGIPLVIVNISEFRCDAILILQTGDLILVSLPSLSSDDVNGLADDIMEAIAYMEDKKAEQTLRKVLYGLWSKIGERVVNSFETAGRLSSDAPLPVRWCLVGRLAFLPVHAASPNPKKYVHTPPSLLDRFVSSHIPTLSSLMRMRSRQLAKFKGMVAISQSATLPSAKDEILAIRQLPSSVNVHFLEDAEATVSAVLDTLGDCTWTHFACHGKQNDESPLDSALQLQDGPLPVSLLAANPLMSAELAVLFACETSKGSTYVADEVIHLAAGLHFAGFRRVVGTMWPIVDSDGPVLTKLFYTDMFKSWPEKEPEAAEAAYALRKAVLHLRDELKAPLKQWLPFILFGM